MSSAGLDTTGTLTDRWARLHRDIVILEMAVEVATEPSPEVVVAGIEARAFVRAQMRRERQHIGEVK